MRVKVAVGYLATSMILVRNELLRSDWSLTTSAMFTLNVPFVAAVPSTVTEPHTSVVRPTAVAFCPRRTSCTR